MLPEELQTRIVQELKNQLEPAFVLLFGSFAKGTSVEQSDIDLAYFNERELSGYERFKLANKLSVMAKREVDLVDIRQADTVFAMQIFADGIPIYIADENSFIAQRMRAYSMYVTLNEQRAPVLKVV